MHRFSFQEEQQLDPQKNMISVNKGQITAVKRSRSVHWSVSPSSERGANARNVNLTYLLTMAIWRFSTSLISSFRVSLPHQYGTTVWFYFPSTTGKNWSSSSFLIADFFDLLLSSETRQLQGVNISSFGAAEQTNPTHQAHQWSKQKWSERAIALTLWSMQSSCSDFSRELFNTEQFVQRNFLRALTVCQSWTAGRIDKSSNTTHSVVKVT